MPDYSKGKIYKIVCNETGLIYVGSTCESSLARRLAGHVGVYKKYLNGGKKCSSYKIIENQDYKIILLENVNCNNIDELHARERHFVENIECVNKAIPNRTKKEWTDDNKDKVNLYKQKYAEKNRDIINEKQRLRRLNYKNI